MASGTVAHCQKTLEDVRNIVAVTGLTIVVILGFQVIDIMCTHSRITELRDMMNQTLTAVQSLNAKLEPPKDDHMQQLVQRLQSELQNGSISWVKATYLFLTNAVLAMGRWDWDRVFSRIAAVGTIAFFAFVIYIYMLEEEDDGHKKTAKKDRKALERASA